MHCVHSLDDVIVRQPGFDHAVERIVLIHRLVMDSIIFLGGPPHTVVMVNVLAVRPNVIT
ncbi:hypothetical protein D3C84_1255560 [compost metagenome]